MAQSSPFAGQAISLASVDADNDSGIAAHIHAARPSPAARAAARQGVLDFLAVTLPVVWGLVDDAGLSRIKALFGAADAGSIALRLGYQGHALDFDDIYSGMRGHPSVVVLPALLALVSRRVGEWSVDDVLDAYVIGVELCGQIAAATGERHYLNGFHATATIGSIAAAGAAAWLLKLDVAAIDNALGLAATRAAGLRAQFGSYGKPLHAGMAARSAVEAALLASAGFSGAARVLEAFVETMGAGAAQPQRLSHAWGPTWGIVSAGLTYKRYPTCGGTHGAADAALALRAQLLTQFNIQEAEVAGAIVQIEVSFPPGADIAPFIRTPRSGIEARFSLEYVIAAALIRGSLALELFAEGPVVAQIAALAARVTRKEAAGVPHDSVNPRGRFHDVSLVLSDGTTLRKRITRDDVLAQPIDLQEKLRGALRQASVAQVEQVLQHASLHTLADIDQLLHALREPADSTQVHSVR